jgi:hypothetical protein
VPNASVLDELYTKLRSLGSALLQENKALQATGEIRDRLEALTKSVAIRQAANAPLVSTGVPEFKSSRDPGKVYRVTFGSAGHLECRVSVGAATVNMFGRLGKVYKTARSAINCGRVSPPLAIQFLLL